MLTPAQPESHIQRSIFILPGSSPFVNAMGVPAIRSAARGGDAPLPSSVNGPLAQDDEGLADKNLL